MAKKKTEVIQEVMPVVPVVPSVVKIEIPVEEAVNSVMSGVLLGGNLFRVYALKQYGKDYEKLAQDEANRINGEVIKL